MTIEEILEQAALPSIPSVPAICPKRMIKVSVASGEWTFSYDNGTTFKTKDKGTAKSLLDYYFPDRSKPPQP